MPDLPPEAEARRKIDRQLASAGWLVQDKRRLNLHAAPGVALCETDVEWLNTKEP
jgi:type I restriction enzyme R subunit